jgi:hypothetical protein
MRDVLSRVGSADLEDDPDPVLRGDRHFAIAEDRELVIVVKAEVGASILTDKAPRRRHHLAITRRGAILDEPCVNGGSRKVLVCQGSDASVLQEEQTVGKEEELLWAGRDAPSIEVRLHEEKGAPRALRRGAANQRRSAGVPAGIGRRHGAIDVPDVRAISERLADRRGEGEPLHGHGIIDVVEEPRSPSILVPAMDLEACACEDRREQ